MAGIATNETNLVGRDGLIAPWVVSGRELLCAVGKQLGSVLGDPLYWGFVSSIHSFCVDHGVGSSDHFFIGNNYCVAPEERAVSRDS